MHFRKEPENLVVSNLRGDEQMIKRTIYGLLAGAAVIFIVLCLPRYIVNLCLTAIAIGGIYEFNQAMKNGDFNPMKVIPYLSCGLLLFITENNSVILYKFSFSIGALIILGMLIYALFFTKRTLVDVCLSFFSMLYIPFLLSFVLMTFYIEDVGRSAIWLIILGACLTDAFAYFVGVRVGKHKLCPNISPHKTIEGSIGGIVGCCVTYVIYAWYLNKYVGFGIEYWQMAIFAVVVAIFAEIGDLVASSIKRFVKTKDFGSILPGHGGVLDRIDSVLFVAPVVYYCLLLFSNFFVKIG